MGKLITIVGNTGSGKTVLTLKLSEALSSCALLETHKERPFFDQFSQDLKRYSLSNQIDYLLYRAEQEIFARQNDIIGVQDGGLDQDFHVFTKLFYRKGFLDEREFQLCERLYSSLRHLLPSPDLIISLSAPIPILVKRIARRQRLDIAGPEDLDEIESLIQGWLSNYVISPVIDIDTSTDDPSYGYLIEGLAIRVRDILNSSSNYLSL